MAAWGTSDDIDQYRRDVARFFERIAALSEANPPPGANAANGWFVKAVREDQEIKSVAPPRGTADDPEAQNVFTILAVYEKRILDAFKIENYRSSWHESSGAALQAFDKLKDELKAVAESIVKVVGLDAASIAELAQSIKNLVDKVHNSGIVYEGEHANGHIQDAVKDASQQANDAFAKIVANPLDPYAKRFAALMMTLTQSIIDKSKYKNDPWLYGDWQVSLQAISQAGAKALYALRPEVLP